MQAVFSTASSSVIICSFNSIIISYGFIPYLAKVFFKCSWKTLFIVCAEKLIEALNLEDSFIELSAFNSLRNFNLRSKILNVFEF